MHNRKSAKDEIGFFRILKTAYPIVFRVCPLYYTSQQFIAVLHGLSHAVSATAIMLFFDNVNRAIQGEIDVWGVLPYFLFHTLVVVGSQVLNGCHNFMHGVVSERITGYMSVKIHEKSSRLDPIQYEDPSKLDDIEKAFKGAQNIFTFTFITTTLIDFYLPYFIYMSFFLWAVNPFLVFAIFLAFIPAMASQLIRTRIMSKLEESAAPVRRENEYLEKSICDISYFKETRILGAFRYLMSLFLNSVKKLNQETLKAGRKTQLLELLMEIISIVAYGFIIVYAIMLLVRGEISVGAFAAVYASLESVFSIMREIVSQHLGTLSENYGLIRNFIRFLNLAEKDGTESEMAANPAISVKDVSFQYPGTDHKSLDGVSLEVRAGETVAIVGQNGAGKTTLARLMTGIYTPTEGEINVGGLDLSTTAPSSIYQNVTGVFQKYQRYKMTLKDNIRISQYSKTCGVEDAAQESGVRLDDINVYPQGNDTMLSREFDGVDLSGGEWQRVALARGFYRDHRFIILDEPTAAIDPIEESKIYRRFIELARDKTAIIITHRMGSATIADRVVVMQDGKIDDVGTHEELMQRRGLYFDMYHAQSSWYIPANKP